MPRPRSQHVTVVKQKLIARLGDGLHRGGDRFFSIRSIAAHFNVSYQTADRLLKELADEGLLNRRRGAGTFVSGVGHRPKRVKLVFARRARRAGSFGARLMAEVEAGFRLQGVHSVRSFVEPDQPASVAGTDYPVMWEVPATAAALMTARRAGLLLNDRPVPGLGALRVDSIAVDDALGGACAAELIALRVGPAARVAVLAGPPDDPRSRLRTAGFTGRFRTATVVTAPTWFRDDAMTPARAILSRHPDAVFACNDRLAQAVIETADEMGGTLPVLFGFDDAPIAERLHLSTIAIPWQELATAVAAVAARRINGDTQNAAHLLMSPRPVIRLS